MVTIVMPAYNAGEWIEEAIGSVMAQTYRDWELLVVDDGSEDDTCAITEKLALEDARIRLIRSGENKGVAFARNHGLSLAKGEYVALLDSDDVWHPEKLERQLALARQTGADIVYCSYGIMGGHGKGLWDDFIVPECTDFESFLVRSVISCSTAMLSRRIVDRYRFDPGYYHEDLVLWLRILRDGYTARGVTQVLAQYRISSGSRSRDKWKSAANRWKVYREYFGISVAKSGRLLIRYALLGLRKYRRTGGEEHGRKHS